MLNSSFILLKTVPFKNDHLLTIKWTESATRNGASDCSPDYRLVVLHADSAALQVVVVGRHVTGVALVVVTHGDGDKVEDGEVGLEYGKS